MKKNQQSIDGFVPRRRTASSTRADNQQTDKTVALVSSRREKVSRNLEKLNQAKNSTEDINEALSRLEIEDSQQNKSDRQSRKETKLQKKIEKFNNKRSKKGKKQLTFQQFKKRRIIRRIITFFLTIMLIWGGYQAYRFIMPLMKLSKGGSILGILQKAVELIY